jgi:hypothetical protein
MRRREGIRWVGVASGDAGSTGEDGAARMGNRGDGMPGLGRLGGGRARAFCFAGSRERSGLSL